MSETERLSQLAVVLADGYRRALLKLAGEAVVTGARPGSALWPIAGPLDQARALARPGLVSPEVVAAVRHIIEKDV